MHFAGRGERGPCLATASTIPVLSWANRSTIVQRSLKIQRSPRCEIHEYEFRDREIFFLRSSTIFEEFFFSLESDRRIREMEETMEPRYLGRIVSIDVSRGKLFDRVRERSGIGICSHAGWKEIQIPIAIRARRATE